MTESPAQCLLHAYRVDLEDLAQGVERGADALRLAESGECPRVGTRGPARHHGEWRRAAEPPDGERRIAEQEAIGRQAVLARPDVAPDAQADPRDRSHLQRLKRLFLSRQRRRKVDGPRLEHAERCCDDRPRRREFRTAGSPD